MNCWSLPSQALGVTQGLLEFGGEFVEAHGESPGKISDTRQMRTPLNISTG
jgi:hypothetical protein